MVLCFIIYEVLSVQNIFKFYSVLSSSLFFSYRPVICKGFENQIWGINSVSKTWRIFSLVTKIFTNKFFWGAMHSWWIVFGEWLTDERCLGFISSRDHCQRFSPSQISETPRQDSNLRRIWIQNLLNEVVQ